MSLRTPASQEHQHAQQQTPASKAEQEMARMAREDQRWRTTLLDLLIEDARNGNVKDPEDRNVKGRGDKRVKASRVGRKSKFEQTGTQRGPETEMQIESAQSAVNSLAALTKSSPVGGRLDDMGGEEHIKLVRLEKLV